MKCDINGRYDSRALYCVPACHTEVLHLIPISRRKNTGLTCLFARTNYIFVELLRHLLISCQNEKLFELTTRYAGYICATDCRRYELLNFMLNLEKKTLPEDVYVAVYSAYRSRSSRIFRDD